MCKSARLLDSKITKMMLRSLYGNEDSTLSSVVHDSH